MAPKLYTVHPTLVNTPEGLYTKLFYYAFLKSGTIFSRDKVNRYNVLLTALDFRESWKPGVIISGEKVKH